MIRPFFGWLALGVGVTLLMMCAGLLAPLQIVLAIGLGWASFLIRVLPEESVAWGGVASALACVVLIAVLGHGFGGWLVDQVAPGRRWRKRWTASLLGGVVVMFVAGIAAAGTAHQVGWLMTSEGSWFRGSHTTTQPFIWAKNLRQIGLGLIVYSHQYDSFPPGAAFDADGTPLHGWPTLILPHDDNAELYNAINLDRPWNDPEKRGELSNEVISRAGIGIHRNPGVSNVRDDKRLTTMGYASNAWVIGGDKPRPISTITVGLAQTILAGEAAGAFRPWADPNNWRDPKLGINRSPLGFGGPYPGGANFLFADGSVKFLRNGTDQHIFEALCTPSGGEKFSADTY